MEKLKSKPGSRSNGSSSKSKGLSGVFRKEAPGNGMRSVQLRELFEEELKDIYWADKTRAKAVPRMIKDTASLEMTAAY